MPNSDKGLIRVKQVLCVSLDGSGSSRSPMSLEEPSNSIDSTPLAYFSKDERKTRPAVWFEAAQRALALAEWETIPRVRSIQVIILFTQYLQLCTPHRGQPSQLATWLAGAIRIAQTLGLHLLGSNPQTCVVCNNCLTTLTSCAECRPTILPGHLAKTV